MPSRPASKRTGRAAVAKPPTSLTLPFDSIEIPDEPQTIQQGPLSVSELILTIRQTLQTSIGEVWVAGEISNLRVPPSGHFYFTLNDERAQIAVVMFRGANSRLRFRPEDGLEVILRGSAQVYEARGTLQLIADTMEPRGVGALQLAIEQLKQRLAAEGLFAEERKRSLPYIPTCVGIVTAPRGAAVRDMIVTLRQRLPGLPILLRPVRVQGNEAPADIVDALADLQRDASVDVIIVGRGGGSTEDLAAFSDERVARAIAACTIPVVSAVGHEIDWSIADLVADRRAATPTAAASIVVPDARELADIVDNLGDAAARAMARLLRRNSERIQSLSERLRDPRQVLQALQMRVDELSERAVRTAMTRLRHERDRVQGLSGRLHALSPLAVLDRGYAILRRQSDGVIVRRADELVPGELLQAHFAQSDAILRVEPPTATSASAVTANSKQRRGKPPAKTEESS